MYGKLFASCFTGSMAGSGADTFAVWAYCLANASADGSVELNPKLIAIMIGMDENRVRNVIATLCSPDANSRSKEKDGRRLEKLGEFLYDIVNFNFYRAIQTRKNQNDYMRRYMKDKRDKERAILSNCANVNGVNTTVSNVSTQVDTEVDAKVDIDVDTNTDTEEKGDSKGEKETKPIVRNFSEVLRKGLKNATN